MVHLLEQGPTKTLWSRPTGTQFEADNRGGHVAPSKTLTSFREVSGLHSSLPSPGNAIIVTDDDGRSDAYITQLALRETPPFDAWASEQSEAHTLVGTIELPVNCPAQRHILIRTRRANVFGAGRAFVPHCADFLIGGLNIDLQYRRFFSQVRPQFKLGPNGFQCIDLSQWHSE